MSSSFDADEHPGQPRVLFIGLAESSHTHSWIDLLEGSGLNVRLFAVPSAVGVPPESWKVRTYVSVYTGVRLDPQTRSWIYPANRLERVARRGLARAFGRWNVQEFPARWLAEIIRRWRPHVIHTLGLDPAAYFYLDARRRYGLAGIGKWVAQVRGGPELALERLLPEKVGRIREVFAECDQMVADNRRNYDYALELGLRPEKLSTLGPVPGTGGIDVDELAQRWQGPPAGRRVLLWPKAYECPQGKALPVYEALKLAWAHLPACEIHMLAMTPETRMWFQTLPEEIRRSCRTEERIPRAGVLDLMTRARVLFSPALSDGVPNAMYEAMAAGAFPIVSPIETIQEVVEPERNVLFARNLYPREMADALVRAMTDDALVERAARENLALVRRVADRGAIRERVIEFYGGLARG